MSIADFVLGLFCGFWLGFLTMFWLDKPEINKNRDKDNYYNHLGI